MAHQKHTSDRLTTVFWTCPVCWECHTILATRCSSLNSRKFIYSLCWSKRFLSCFPQCFKRVRSCWREIFYCSNYCWTSTITNDGVHNTGSRQFTTAPAISKFPHSSIGVLCVRMFSWNCDPSYRDHLVTTVFRLSKDILAFASPYRCTCGDHNLSSGHSVLCLRPCPHET